MSQLGFLLLSIVAAVIIATASSITNYMENWVVVTFVSHDHRHDPLAQYKLTITFYFVNNMNLVKFYVLQDDFLD